MTKPFCAIPFVRAFVLSNGIYRNCCAAEPQINSKSTDFVHWWSQDQQFMDFKEKLQDTLFPTECQSCAIQEQTGASMRTNANQLNPKINPVYPREWSIMFGNTCNLSCWTCNEHWSSTIESHKRTLKILPSNYTSPNNDFENSWPNLRENILKSYDHHEDVTINILGGEPTYNPIVVEFLNWLLQNEYASRTRLEITTNGTKNKKLTAILNRNYWKYIYVAVSVDAVGERAEWIRYGSRWQDVNDSIDYYIEHANYVELHCTLSVLNIQDLPDVVGYANSKNIKVVVIPLQQPSYMSLASWDGAAFELDPSRYQNLQEYVALIGQNPESGSEQRLNQYIAKFATIRKPKPKHT
jgi:MoaA/NifB/PqqE/SkfB family radical SAM enzyme